jgi:hypothetical protein
MNDFATELKLIQLQGEAQEQRHVMLQLRKFLANALCCRCGEPLGYGEIVTNDEETKTLHRDCDKPDDDD